MTAAPPPSRRSRRRGGIGRGTLVLLALFLASSGALRLGAGLGGAFARTAETGAEPAPPAECPQPPAALLEALQEQEARITAREAALADRQAALNLTETAVRQRIAALEAAEARLAATLDRADGAAEADLARLTEVYESMKPKVAAGLFSAMAPEFASGFLGRMRPDAAAAILSGMTPDAAYAVSALLAARHTDVPRN